eukprot:1158780-Pelagomonas_calceolata.AAC.9
MDCASCAGQVINYTNVDARATLAFLERKQRLRQLKGHVLPGLYALLPEQQGPPAETKEQVQAVSGAAPQSPSVQPQQAQAGGQSGAIQGMTKPVLVNVGAPFDVVGMAALQAGEVIGSFFIGARSLKFGGGPLLMWFDVHTWLRVKG